MARALQKVAELAPAYTMYLQHEVLPILRAGFLPPIAEGLARFIATPQTQQAISEIVREQTTGDNVGEFDTHPPLGERVAALQRLRVQNAVGGDSDLPFLSNPDKEMRLLLEYGGADSAAKLSAIRWEDVGESVYAKQWHQLVDAHASWFGGLTIGNLPAGKKSYNDMGASLKNPGETLVGAEDRRTRAAYLMTAGLGAALLRAGWRIETGPGLPLEVKRGEDSVDPRDVIMRLVENAATYKEWKSRCDALGIADIALAPSSPAPLST